MSHPLFYLTAKNVYFNEEKGIKINEYIEGSSLDKHYREEGKVHNFNFLDVASHFINNVNDAFIEFKKI